MPTANGGFQLGLLPEKKWNWRTFATSYGILVGLILLLAIVGLLSLAGSVSAQPMDRNGVDLKVRENRIDNAIHRFVNKGRITPPQAEDMFREIHEARAAEDRMLHANGGFLTPAQHDEVAAHLDRAVARMHELKILDSEW